MRMEPTVSLRLTWQLFASSFKRHACKRALCICGPCGGRELGHSQDRSCLYKEGLASRATLPSLKATRVVALAIETERFAPRAPLGCSRKGRACHLLGYERLQSLQELALLGDPHLFDLLQYHWIHPGPLILDVFV